MLSKLLQMSAGNSVVDEGIQDNPDGWDVTRAYLSPLNDTNDFNYQNITSLSSSTSVDTSAYAIYADSTGTRVYIASPSSPRSIRQYTQNLPGEILTAVASKSISSQTSNPRGLYFKPDGTKAYVAELNGTLGLYWVYQYTLSTPWDITTLTYTNVRYDTTSQASGGIFFRADGTVMYRTGTSPDKAIYQYSLSTPWDLSTISFVTSYSVASPYASNNGSPIGVTFSPNGLQMYVRSRTSVTLAPDLCFNLSTAWNMSTASLAYTAVPTSGTNGGFFVDLNGKYYYYLDDTTKTIGIRSLMGDLTSTLAGTVSSSFVSPDGNLILKQNNNTIQEISMSTPWNVYTSTAGQTKSTGKSFQWDMYFTEDGTKAYSVATSPNDYVYQYSLSTPWNISTLSFVRQLLVQAQDDQVYGVTLDPSGKKMYVLGRTTDKVYQYSLSTAWDISTATSTGNFSVLAQSTVGRCIRFSPSGKKMYIVGSTSLFQYNLSTAWNVSTAVYYARLNAANVGTLDSFTWKPDGTQLIVNSGRTSVVYNIAPA